MRRAGLIVVAALVVGCTSDSLAPPTTAPPPDPENVEVTAPEDPAGAPSVVLVHGGGWVGGSPESTAPLAADLAERGAIAFNAGYRTLRRGGGHPMSFDDVACAVRFARVEGEGMGGSGEVILVGHSAGAHIASVVALSADSFASDCPWEATSTPDRLVGLAGIYEIQSVAPIMELFLGGTIEEAADAWEASDPFAHLEAAANLDVTLIHGTADRVVPPASSQQFADALTDTGTTVEVLLLDTEDHSTVLQPAVTGPLILP